MIDIIEGTNNRLYFNHVTAFITNFIKVRPKTCTEMDNKIN